MDRRNISLYDGRFLVGAGIVGIAVSVAEFANEQFVAGPLLLCISSLALAVGLIRLHGANQ